MYWFTGILGFVLLVAPFVIGYNNNQAALWTSLAAGATVIVVSFLEGMAHGRDRWEYWAALVVGIAAILAPFVLQFSIITTAMWTTVAIGALLAILAGSKLIYD